MTWQHNLILFGAAAIAGMVNSVAGGGTLLTFPALLSAGFDSVIANATSTVALWPGQFSSMLGYRKEIGQNRTAIVRLAIPSFLGGALGAWLLLHTPHSFFDRIVPFLILLATVLFMVQEPLARRQRARAEQVRNAQASAIPAFDSDSPSAPPTANSSALPDVSSTAVIAPEGEPSPAAWAGVMTFQFFVAIYGGYFGAGIGILMLATLGYMGFTNIHRMNGLKNINGLCINAVASVLFISSGQVKWHVALLMAAGSIVGGYTGAGTARRIGQRNVRRVIIGIGLALAFWLLVKSVQPRSADVAPSRQAPTARPL